MTSVFHALSQLFLETVNLSLWFQIDQNQNCSMDKVQNEGKEKKVNMQRFRSQQWRRHVGAHPDGHQHGDRKPTETSVTKFCYKNVNLSLEGLKNTKISHFFNQHGSSDSRPPCWNSTSCKSFEIQAESITKPRTHSERKFCMNSSFQLLLHIMNAISQEKQ